MNYPVIIIYAIIGAIAAGNCVVLKASEFAPVSCAVMKKWLKIFFDPAYILFAEGDGATVVRQWWTTLHLIMFLYRQQNRLEKLFYKMAAESLYVTLELGGKVHNVVESDTNIAVAARRICLQNFQTQGKMCEAPDYVLLRIKKKKKRCSLYMHWKIRCQKFLWKPKQITTYCKIINEKNNSTGLCYLQQGNIVYGTYNKQNLFIAPTILENIFPDDAVMQEIFRAHTSCYYFWNKSRSTANYCIAIQNPLAFYIFTSKCKRKQWFKDIFSVVAA